MQRLRLLITFIRIWIKRVEKNCFWLDKARERITRDLDQVQCI